MPRIQTNSLAAHRDWRRNQLIEAAAAIAQDSASRLRIIELLKKLRSQGKVILIVTHSDERALDWCDQIFDLGA